MKIIIYILLSIFTFCNVELYAQCLLQIDTVSYSYFNGITGHKQIIDNYKITNNSNEEYFTWVSLVPVNNKSNIELIRDFFKIRKGDFNYVEIMYEEFTNMSSDIGYTFIKKISPNETFSYFIAKTNSSSTFYKDRIVIIKKNEVEQFLKLQVVERYFFQLSSIFLIENDLQKNTISTAIK